MSEHSKIRICLFAFLVGGIGGTFPDWAYIPSILTNGKIPWYTFLHSPWVALIFVGVAIASFRGLERTHFLRRKQ